MDRRRFLKILAIGSVAAVLTPTVSLAKVLSARTIRALKSGKYPGNIKPIDNTEVNKPAKWLG